jgi:hypothetical protein
MIPKLLKFLGLCPISYAKNRESLMLNDMNQKYIDIVKSKYIFKYNNEYNQYIICYGRDLLGNMILEHKYIPNGCDEISSKYVCGIDGFPEITIKLETDGGITVE